MSVKHTVVLQCAASENDALHVVPRGVFESDYDFTLRIGDEVVYASADDVSEFGQSLIHLVEKHRD